MAEGSVVRVSLVVLTALVLALATGCGGGSVTTVAEAPQTVEWGQTLDAGGLRVSVTEPVSDGRIHYGKTGSSTPPDSYRVCKVTIEVLDSVPSYNRLDATYFTYECNGDDLQGAPPTSDQYSSLPPDLGNLKSGEQVVGYVEFLVSFFSEGASGAGDYVRLELPAENGAPTLVRMWRTP